MYVILFGFICAVLQVFMTYRRYVTVLKWLDHYPLCLLRHRLDRANPVG